GFARTRESASTFSSPWNLACVAIVRSTSSAEDEDSFCCVVARPAGTISLEGQGCTALGEKDGLLALHRSSRPSEGERDPRHYSARERTSRSIFPQPADRAHTERSQSG